MKQRTESTSEGKGVDVAVNSCSLHLPTICCHLTILRLLHHPRGPRRLKSGMKEVHIIKYTPFICPWQSRRRPIDKLQPILLLIAPKLIIIHSTPRESRNHIDPICMSSLQYLAKETLEVARPLEIISLRILRACAFHEWVEAEFGDGDAGGAEGIPYVALMLAEVLRGEVCVGVALFAVDPAVSLDVGGEDAGGVEGVG